MIAVGLELLELNQVEASLAVLSGLHLILSEIDDGATIHIGVSAVERNLIGIAIAKEVGGIVVIAGVISLAFDSFTYQLDTCNIERASRAVVGRNDRTGIVTIPLLIIEGHFYFSVAKWSIHNGSVDRTCLKFNNQLAVRTPVLVALTKCNCTILREVAGNLSIFICACGDAMFIRGSTGMSGKIGEEVEIIILCSLSIRRNCANRHHFSAIPSIRDVVEVGHLAEQGVGILNDVRLRKQLIVEAHERTVPLVNDSLTRIAICSSPGIDNGCTHQCHLVVMLVIGARVAAAGLMIAKARGVINIHHQRNLITMIGSTIHGFAVVQHAA